MSVTTIGTRARLAGAFGALLWLGSACAGHGRSAHTTNTPSATVHQTPAAAEPIAATQRQGLELDVLRLSHQAAHIPDSLPAQSCVGVTIDFHNLGTKPVTVSGREVLFIQVGDRTGPVGVTDNNTGATSHQAVKYYLSPCLPVGTGTGSGQGGGEVPATPPDTTLLAGETSTPITLYFAVSDPANQPLTLLWQSQPALRIQ